MSKENNIKKYFNNSFFRILAHSKSDFFKDLNIYNKIKNLGVFDVESYLKYHKGCIANDYDPLLHYIYYSSKSDDLETKRHYIDELFDLNFYKYANNLKESEDPLIHYITEGFEKNYLINSIDEGFVKDLNTDLNKQWIENFNKKIVKELENNRFITDSSVIIPYSEAEKPFCTNSIRVGVFLEDSFENMNACPYIRLNFPLKELSRSNQYHFFIFGKELLPKLDFDKFMQAKCFDVIILQRTTSFYACEILEKAKMHDIKIIYETDDALLDIKKNNPSYPVIQKFKDKILNVMHNSQAIVVSTPSLVDNFKQKGYDNVCLIRNYYLYDCLPIRRMDSFDDKKTIKIGYFGTKSHDEDLNEVYDIILKLRQDLKANGVNLDFEIVGATNLNLPQWISVIDLPFYPMSMVAFMKWLSSNVKWDIGIAPLKDTYFNQSKSELKYIEFTALGVPVVASNIGAYCDAINDGYNGFLAEDETEWLEDLKKLALNEDFRMGMVNNARENLFKNYNVQDRAKQWDNVFKKVLNS